MSVTYFFRKPHPNAHSIEEIFTASHQYIKKNEKEIQTKTLYLPFPSKTIIGILKNIIFTHFHQDRINHITGDAHYIALGIFKGRIVLTIHDCILLSRTPRWKPKFWVYKWLWYDLPVWKADNVTTISEKSKNDIVKYTGCHPDKIRVISNFVHPIFHFSPKAFELACPRILHIGITPNKNLERVIPALAGVACIFEIIGILDDATQRLLEQFEIKYENRADLPLEVVAERYQAADMVVFVSTYEGFGMPVIEAQATGRPVVTSNLEPMPWVAGEGACFVDPFNITDIRAGILKVIQQEDYRKELILRGVKNAQRFAFHSTVEEYLDIYKGESLTPLNTEKI